MMSIIYSIIAFLVASYCFHKSTIYYEEYEDLWWSFIWNITGIGTIVSIFRL